jgi:GH24 family phage-related lysozyme (muramidase)
MAKSTMLILINKGRQGCCGTVRPLVYAGEVKLSGLVKRRAAEKALFLDGLREAT